MISVSGAATEAPPLSCDEMEERGLRRRVKYAAIRLLGRVGWGFWGVLGSRAGGAVGILTYHRVCPRFPGVPTPGFHVTPDRFRQQLRGLQKRGFSFWPLSRILACRRSGEPIPRQTLVVTFDDGFEATHRWAWPVLRELAVPATIFVVTGCLDSPEPFYFDPWGHSWRDCLPREAYAPLRSEQYAEMIRSGLIELGTHTHTHADFRGQPEAMLDELRLSIGILRDRFAVGGPVMFALPFGKPRLGFASAECMEAAGKAGVSCVLTTETRLVDPQSDPFGWGRFNVFPWDTGGTLAGKVSGWYGWAPTARDRLLRKLGRGLVLGASVGSNGRART